MDNSLEEKPPNDRAVGKEYGVAGPQQLAERKAARELPEGYYYPPGATEPVPIEE
jgi:hypothetical protein